MNAGEGQMGAGGLARIQRILQQADDTRFIETGRGCTDRLGAVFRKSFGQATAVIVADLNTYEVGGKRAEEVLVRNGVEVADAFVFNERRPYANYENALKIVDLVTGTRNVIPVAVGSGTINDLVKLGAHLGGKRYMAYATAASMDGYTSYGASITRNGVKQTIYCPAPVAVVADTDVICQAPAGMNASGYADLLAKVTAGADWLVADAMGVEPVHERAWEMLQPHLARWVSDPEGIFRGSIPATECLLEGLIIAGLAMQAAKSSRPASGAEHQFSHLWDMEHHIWHGEEPSHGFKVGIGMLASSLLYEQLLALNPLDLPIDSICGEWPDKETLVRQVNALHQGQDFAGSVLPELMKKYLTANELRERLLRLQRVWPELRQKLRGQLQFSSRQLAAMLAAAGAPSHPEEIGIGADRMRASYLKAQTIRSRYTVLDLAIEVGQLESWSAADWDVR